jgi:hypothetical protein
MTAEAEVSPSRLSGRSVTRRGSPRGDAVVRRSWTLVPGRAEAETDRDGRSGPRVVDAFTRSIQILAGLVIAVVAANAIRG